MIGLLLAFILAQAQAQARADVAPVPQMPTLEQIQSGAYLVKIAGCADCHTPNPDEPFAGGYRLETPFGVFFSPNISPDKETGIGNWSLEDFRGALHGKSPHGESYYPAFPYPAYSQISDQDAELMWDYLKSQRPIHKVNRPHLLQFPYNQRKALWGWQKLYLGPTFEASPEKGPEWNRGAYLAEAFAHCAECHTPRNTFGALKTSEWMGGSDAPVGGKYPPNITPDKVNGLGAWSTEDWERFLASGRDPEGHFPSAEMAQVIQNTSSLTAADRHALVIYIMSLEPVRRGVDVP